MKYKRIANRDGDGRVRWQCPLCTHSWDFRPSDLEHIEFLAVYHLASRHRLCGFEILGLFPELLEAVNAYFG